MVGALEHDQIIGLEAEQLFEAATAIAGEHFQFMDGESALAMMEAIGIEQALGLDGVPSGRDFRRYG